MFDSDLLVIFAALQAPFGNEHKLAKGSDVEG